MRKIVYIPCLLLFFYNLLIPQAYAAVTPNTGDSSSTSTPTIPTSSTPNPGFTNGTACGNTICLPTETCTQYPGDTQPHCIPNTPPSTNLKSCNTVSFFGLNIPWTFNNSFPPNSKCYNEVTNTQTDLSLYAKTCIYEPVVNYTYSTKNKSFKDECGPSGDSGPGKKGDNCSVWVLANTDVKNAELGSYGPNADVYGQDYTQYRQNALTDQLSQKYLYNSLFDRPNDYTNQSGMTATPQYINKEGYRTYWRLMPANNQANLRSFIMNAVKEKLIKNTDFSYIDRNGQSKHTSANDLYNHLKFQVTLFLHWPFVRFGCLTQYPVCPEYAQAQNDLLPKPGALITLLKLIPSVFLPDSVKSAINTAIDTWNSIALANDLSAAYAAFIPFDFDSARSYIALKGNLDNFSGSYSVSAGPISVGVSSFGIGSLPTLNTVSREHLGYINAITQGLLSPKFGLISTLKPQWMNEIYATKGTTLISDYALGNSTDTFPENKLYQKGLVQILKEFYEGITTNPWEYALSTFNNFFARLFTDNKQLFNKVGYTSITTNEASEKNEIPKDQILKQYVNTRSCPLPVSYHIISPKTRPIADNNDDHHQIIKIEGDEIDWQYNPIIHKKECRNNTICCRGLRPEGDQCIEDKWDLSATKQGRALTVLNNPKQTDIQKSVASDPKISLYDMLLPADAQKATEAKIDAPISINSYVATTPRGSGKVTNQYESIIRENNLAQDSVHLLQNCWTIPKDLQNSPKCQPPTPTSSAGGGVCDSNVSNDQINSAIQTVTTKYGIPAKWLEAMWKLEGGSTQLGANCQESGTYAVMGPMQIATGTYNLVTCANERFSNGATELAQCSDATKLSRCSLQGSLELAARVILQKLNAYGAYSGSYDCHATKSTANLTQLFRAVNAYGACAIVPGTTKSYAQWVCEYASNCPSPLPPVGQPISCQGN